MPEKVVLVFHPSRLTYLKWYFFASLLMIFEILILLNFVIIPEMYKFYFLIFLPIIALLVISILEIKRKTDIYTITDYRIVGKTGIFSISETTIPWNRISDYSIFQSFSDRLFKIGTLKIEGVSGDEKPEIIIKKVPNLKKIKDIIETLIQRSRKYGPVV